MPHFALITNTFSSDTPEYTRAQSILKWRANELSREYRLNQELPDAFMVPLPVYVPKKWRLKLSLRNLLP